MRKIALSAVAFLAAVTLSACSTDDSENVVTMEGDNITKEELYEAMKPLVGDSTLQRMIIIRVLDNEIGENNFAADAEAETRSQMASVGGEETFLSFLGSMGFQTIQDYQDQIHLNLLMTEALEQRTPISDEEIEAAYEGYMPPITASHILVEDEALAQDIIDQLNDGADFAELAQEHSTDGSAQNGGSLGEFGQGRMVAEFEEAAYALEEGEITQTPVQSEFGYHIIRLDAKTEKGTLEEEKDNIRESLLQSKLSDAAYLDSVIVDIFTDANIEIHDEDFEDLMAPYLGETATPEETESVESTESEASSAE